MSNFSLIKLRNIFTFVLHGGGERIIVNREESKSQMDSLDHLESMISEINHQTCNVAKKIFTL